MAKRRTTPEELEKGFLYIHGILLNEGPGYGRYQGDADEAIEELRNILHDICYSESVAERVSTDDGAIEFAAEVFAGWISSDD